MSYPKLLHPRCSSDDYVVFTVPNDRVIRKITTDCIVEETLRVQVAAKVLSSKVAELASLFSDFHMEATSIKGRNEMTVKLFEKPRIIPQEGVTRHVVEVRPTYTLTASSMRPRSRPQLATIVEVEDEVYVYL